MVGVILLSGPTWPCRQKNLKRSFIPLLTNQYQLGLILTNYPNVTVMYSFFSTVGVPNDTPQ